MCQCQTGLAAAGAACTRQNAALLAFLAGWLHTLLSSKFERDSGGEAGMGCWFGFGASDVCRLYVVSSQRQCVRAGWVPLIHMCMSWPWMVGHDIMSDVNGSEVPDAFE